MPPTNAAAWQNALNQPLEIRAAPYTAPKADEIVVRAHAWATNPIDHILQQRKLFPWLTYPRILGMDLAGEVVEVGSSAVSRFRPGDRVLAAGSGLRNELWKSAFQTYVVVRAVLAARIPDAMSYAQAAVFPLALSTAASGLFQRDFLALRFPSVPLEPTGKTVVVWGAASAVGCNAVQLAAAAGYEVFATASSTHFDALRDLGASRLFDYRSPTVIDDIVAAVDEVDFAGIYHAAGPSASSLEIARRAKRTVFVASATYLPEEMPEGVAAKMVWGTSLEENEVGPAVYEHFLPKALEVGVYKVAPEPWVVGRRGLESLQEAVDAHREGVSFRKPVVVEE